MFVLAFPFEPAAASIDVVCVPWSRNEHGTLAGLKTISYAENVRALAYAARYGAGEAIFLNTRGELCEATGSNVFLVRDGKLCTPPASAGCLLGVTRALLIELCAEIGIGVDERDIELDALATADEAFLSSTTREVQPIAHVDGHASRSVRGPVSSAACRSVPRARREQLRPVTRLGTFAGRARQPVQTVRRVGQGGGGRRHPR